MNRFAAAVTIAITALPALAQTKLDPPAGQVSETGRTNQEIFSAVQSINIPTIPEPEEPAALTQSIGPGFGVPITEAGVRIRTNSADLTGNGDVLNTNVFQAGVFDRVFAHRFSLNTDRSDPLRSGRAFFDQLEIITSVGRSTPRLFDAQARNEPLDVELIIARSDVVSGETVRFMTIELVNAVIAEHEWLSGTIQGASSSLSTYQRITLAFEDVIIRDDDSGIEFQGSTR
ncbi:MAG: type VI secretion system tube protein Hcp [Planctomycetota bacterium]